MRTIVQGLVVCVLISTSAAAKDIQVDNVRGDDTRDGGTGRVPEAATGPVRTIARALQLAIAGDRIVLTKSDRPYRESLTLQGPRHSGSDLLPFEIDGQGAILDGTCPVAEGVWQFVERDIFRMEPPSRTTGLLMVDGLPANGAANPDRLSWKLLEPGQAVLTDGAVWFRVEPNRIPANYELRWTVGRVGLTLYDVRNVVIRDLVVQGFALDGINLHDRATGITLEGLTLRGNGRSGLHVGGACRATLAASLAGNNGRAQVHLEGAARLQVTDCELLENPAPAIWDEVTQSTRSAPAVDRPARAGFVDAFWASH